MRTSSFTLGTVGLLALLGLGTTALGACTTRIETIPAPGTGATNPDGTTADTDGTDPTNPGAGKDPTDPETPPGPVVEGLSISEIAVFQGVKVSVLKGTQWISSRNAKVVAGRPGMIRIYVTPDAGFDSKSVTAELRLVDGTKKFPIIRETKTISKASVEADLSTTFNLDIPAESLTRGVTMQVSLTSSDGTKASGPSPGRYPQDGSFKALGAQTSGVVKVVVVPVKYLADGSGRTPDVSQAQLDLYKRAMMSLYPATDVEITARAPYSFNSAISANGSGFSQILNAITQLRRQDGVEDDVYYYGAFAPKTSFSSFCGGGCVTGLSAVADGDTPYLRASVGLGFTGDDSAETMTHEIGHAHGRNHAPCGGAAGADPQYPYPNAALGVIGYDIFEKKLLSSTKYHDLMSYCPPSWVSDYTYDALFERISEVAQSVGSTSSAVAQSFRTAEVQADGSMKWTDEIVLRRAPTGGQTREVKFLSETGIQVGTETARFYPYDHMPGGVLIVPQAQATWATAKVGAISIR